MARISPTTTIAALLLFAGSASSVANAQSWAAPVNGQWFSAPAWSPAVVPTGAGATGTLGLSGTYTVTTTTNTLLGVNITNSQATLGVTPGYVLTLVGSGPGVVNTLNGQLVVNATGANSVTHLTVGAPLVTFAGTGTLRLKASPSDPFATRGTADIQAVNGGSLVMGSGTTLGGFGQILNVPTTNYGTFTADQISRTLLINAGTHQNYGLYTATNGAAVVIQNATVNQGAAGVMAPVAGGEVRLTNVTVNGGGVTSVPTGRVKVMPGANAKFDGVTVNGGLDLYNGTTTLVEGAGLNIATGAEVKVNVPSSFNITRVLTSEAATPITGGGTLRLAASPTDTMGTNQTAALGEDGVEGHGSFLFGSGVTLAGVGEVNNVSTTNNGVFSADIGGRPLRIDSNIHVNNGVYEATDGGDLVVVNATIMQGPAGVITATGTGPDSKPSMVQLANTGVSGGALASVGDAHVRVNPDTVASLSNVALNGVIDVYDGATLYIDSPGITLNGGATLLVNAPASFSATLVRSADVGTLIGGSGTVRLNASPSDADATDMTAALCGDGEVSGTFTFAPGVVLAGFGSVHDVATVNNGVFNADIEGRPLLVHMNTHQNNNFYAATGGGMLTIMDATVNQAATAWVLAGDGSTVAIGASRINGGTIGSPVGGTGFAAIDGSVVTLEGVKISRQLAVDAGGTLATASGFTLLNNGVLTVNTAGGSAPTQLYAKGEPTFIGGTGRVHLNAAVSDGETTGGTADLTRDDSLVESGFEFGPGITVDGFGRIHDCPTINHGTVNANVADRPLRIEGGMHQNQSLFAATNGGELWLYGTAVFQTGAGSTHAGNGSTVMVSGATLRGGTLTSDGTGRVVVEPSGHVEELTTSAPVYVSPGAVLTVDMRGITNNGVITVNTTGADTATRMRANAADTGLFGTGEVRLHRAASDTGATLGTAELGASAAGDSFVFGPDQLLTGSGRINCPVFMGGTVSPGVGFGVVDFIRNEAGATLDFIRDGRLRIDTASVSSFDRLVNAGVINLGGTLQVDSAFNAAPGTTFDVIVGDTINGQFGSVVSSGLASPKQFGARYDLPGLVRVTVLCGAADIGSQGGVAYGDGVLDNNDFIVFIDRFFNNDPRADYGSTGGVPGADGLFNNNDFVVFIDLFFASC